MQREVPVVACSLTSDELAARAEEFKALLATTLSSERIENGARLTLPPGNTARVRDLLDREKECCPFWDFTIAEGTDAIVVEARAPSSAALMVDLLFAMTPAGDPG